MINPEEVNNSSLVRTFGFNNICINWDFDPVRTIIAMVWPFVEVPLVFYMFTKIFKWTLLYYAKQLSRGLYYLIFFFIVLQIIFALFFRITFVQEVYVNVLFHSLPFIGMQWSLCLVSIENFIYLAYTRNLPLWHHQCRFLSVFLSIAYIFVLLISTITNNVYVISVFAGSPVFNIKDPAQLAFVTANDIFWMVTAVVIPVFLAIRGRIVTTDVMFCLPLNNLRKKKKTMVEEENSENSENESEDLEMGRKKNVSSENNGVEGGETVKRLVKSGKKKVEKSSDGPLEE